MTAGGTLSRMATVSMKLEGKTSLFIRRDSDLQYPLQVCNSEISPIEITFLVSELKPPSKKARVVAFIPE